jgi:preprotein translocase SecE subunit
LATKGNKTTKKAEEPKITRIKAKDSSATPKKEDTASVEPLDQETQKSKNPLKAMGGYFKGAWFELKQVRWPTRRATWGLTLAVLGYTAIIGALILLLDALFKYLFELMLG